MKAASILVTIGCAIILAACATAAANVTSRYHAVNDPESPRRAVESEHDSNAGPALTVKEMVSNCPVTRAIDPTFEPPPPYPSVAPYGQFWYGNDTLWTMLVPGGKWNALPNDGAGYGQKVFWWSSGYDGRSEPVPSLHVTGRQLDGDATFKALTATNAFHEDFGGWAMLTGVNVPTPGCWEISGEYEGETSSFVVQVGK